MFAQVGMVAGDGECVGDLPRWPLLAELAEWEGVFHRSLLALVAAGASWWQEFVEQVGDGLLECLVQGGWSGGGLVADLVAGQAQGDGERDSVGVGPGGLRRVEAQAAQRLVDGEEGEDLLADQLRAARAQDDLGPAQPGLQFAVAQLDLPALLIGLGQLSGGRLFVVEQGGDQAKASVRTPPSGLSMVTSYSMTRTGCPAGGSGNGRRARRASP